MAWTVWCEIVCEDCADTVAGQHNEHSLNKREMAKEARRAGWKLTGDEWRCRRCKNNPEARRV